MVCPLRCVSLSAWTYGRRTASGWGRAESTAAGDAVAGSPGAPFPRPDRRSGGRLGGVLLVVAALLLGACSRAPQPGQPAGGRPAIRIASFDFAESRAVARLYADGLRRAGYPVTEVEGLGAREVVEPALEQAAVDFVPEYTGTALRFLTGQPAAAGADPAAVHRALRTAFAARGIAVLGFAPAEDRNGIVVAATTASLHSLRRISDLRRVAATMVFGGPPECPQRPLCLPGLRERYGLRFAAFRAMPTRVATAEALESGEIDVGLLETSDPRLATSPLTLLDDDRGLQPPDNVVPVVRQRIVDAYGPGFAAAVNAISATLTTAALVRLNQDFRGR